MHLELCPLFSFCIPTIPIQLSFGYLSDGTLMSVRINITHFIKFAILIHPFYSLFLSSYPFWPSYLSYGVGVVLILYYIPILLENLKNTLDTIINDGTLIIYKFSQNAKKKTIKSIEWYFGWVFVTFSQPSPSLLLFLSHFARTYKPITSISIIK